MSEIASYFANSKINREIRRNQRWVADHDVSDDALRRLVNLDSGLRPKLSRLISVFGLSERLIQKVKWLTVEYWRNLEMWIRESLKIIENDADR